MSLPHDEGGVQPAKMAVEAFTIVPRRRVTRRALQASERVQKILDEAREELSAGHASLEKAEKRLREATIRYDDTSIWYRAAKTRAAAALRQECREVFIDAAGNPTEKLIEFCDQFGERGPSFCPFCGSAMPAAFCMSCPFTLYGPLVGDTPHELAQQVINGLARCEDRDKQLLAEVE